MAKICLDAGHGGKDPGATKYGRKEKDDALKLTLKVGSILKGRGHSIVYTRTTDVYESPNTKAKEGNASGAAFFASFHRNSDDDEDAHGYETLVYANSGKAKVCADTANKKMAAIGFRNRGTKVRTGLAVLNGTTMPAALFENGFISNKSDNALFDAKFSQIAEGLADAIEAAVGKGTSSGTSPSTSSGTSTSGSFLVKVSGVSKGDVLNIRAGAGASYKKTGSLAYNDPNKYTIVQTKKNGSDTWGKLKSGIGWINLKYTKRV